MTDEEKKAIETIKDLKEIKWYEHAFDNGTEILSEEEKQDIDVILNLLEKQDNRIKKLEADKENTMVEVIEEALQEKFSKLKFIVKFVKIKKTYEIKVGNINIFYSWDDTLTFERNIEYIIIYLKLLGGIK